MTTILYTSKFDGVSPKLGGFTVDQTIDVNKPAPSDDLNGIWATPALIVLDSTGARASVVCGLESLTQAQDALTDPATVQATILADIAAKEAAIEAAAAQAQAAVMAGPAGLLAAARALFGSAKLGALINTPIGSLLFPALSAQDWGGLQEDYTALKTTPPTGWVQADVLAFGNLAASHSIPLTP